VNKLHKIKNNFESLENNFNSKSSPNFTHTSNIGHGYRGGGGGEGG